MADYPSMPFYTDAYIADTQHLTNEEHGVYIRLLIFAWRMPDCSLPNDDKRLAIMVGVTPSKWRKLKPSVMSFWALDGEVWRQKKLTEVRERVAKSVQQKSNAGIASAKAKALKSNNPASTAEPTAKATELQQPKPKPKDTPLIPQGETDLFSAKNESSQLDETSRVVEDGFNEFWESIWPKHGRKSGKADCRKVYEQACTGKHKKADQIEPVELNRCARSYVAQEAAKNNDLQYLSGPLVWLRKPGWEPYLDGGVPVAAVPASYAEQILAEYGGGRA